ncbi:hypothetical protein H100_07858 [Trichophyton rubrum MR850]|nr:hypothetical protein H100_07858 [Trichophyton rubrum MR850]
MSSGRHELLFSALAAARGQAVKVTPASNASKQVTKAKQAKQSIQSKLVRLPPAAQPADPEAPVAVLYDCVSHGRIETKQKRASLVEHQDRRRWSVSPQAGTYVQRSFYLGATEDPALRSYHQTSPNPSHLRR